METIEPGKHVAYAEIVPIVQILSSANAARNPESKVAVIRPMENLTISEKPIRPVENYAISEKPSTSLRSAARIENDFQTQSKTLSNLICEMPIEIRFDNLSYTVSEGTFKEDKKVLHNICGKFPPKSLVAIMGPSGAGKSSLLDILSGYRVTGAKGRVLINGKSRVMEEFRRNSCYIQQDDRLQPLLTIKENMMLATELKLGMSVGMKQKNTLIREIITILGLTECYNTRGARLSGGQKKRLSIALELINNPLVMFLDEPTTGLDSLSCTQCISLLKMLAHQGRTIVCTIHQPSASLFQMFDQIYILARGKCLYQGSSENMLGYLNILKIPCPVYHNPADYVIEIASGEYGDDKIDLMIGGVSNGKSLEWFRNSRILFDPEFPEEINQKKSKKDIKLHTTPSSHQFMTLLKRGFINHTRDKTLTHMRLYVNVIVSVLLGFMYQNSGEDASRVMDNYNLMFALIMHLVMSSMMLNILTVPMEINTLMKEHFNRWYSLKMYYAALNILDIPVATFACVGFTTTVYFITSQIYEWHRFVVFTVTSLLLVYISQSVGFIIGTVLDVVNGTFAGPIFLVPMMMFSGFGVNLRDIPEYLKWGTHVSFFRYALENYVTVVLGYNRRPFSCFQFHCHYKYPEKFLHEIAMYDTDVNFSLKALFVTLILCRILGYCVLSWKVRHGR